jgi:hypothetical protein
MTRLDLITQSSCSIGANFLSAMLVRIGHCTVCHVAVLSMMNQTYIDLTPLVRLGVWMINCLKEEPSLYVCDGNTCESVGNSACSLLGYQAVSVESY